jgi:hypothetical protein
MLDPDPDPYQMNTDPKPWQKTSEFSQLIRINACDRAYIKNGLYSCTLYLHHGEVVDICGLRQHPKLLLRPLWDWEHLQLKAIKME